MIRRLLVNLAILLGLAVAGLVAALSTVPILEALAPAVVGGAIVAGLFQLTVAADFTRLAGLMKDLSERLSLSSQAAQADLVAVYRCRHDPELEAALLEALGNTTELWLVGITCAEFTTGAVGLATRDFLENKGKAHVIRLDQASAAFEERKLLDQRNPSRSHSHRLEALYDLSGDIWEQWKSVPAYSVDVVTTQHMVAWIVLTNGALFLQQYHFGTPEKVDSDRPGLYESVDQLLERGTFVRLGHEFPVMRFAPHSPAYTTIMSHVQRLLQSGPAP